MDIVKGNISVFVFAKNTHEGDVSLHLLSNEETGVPPAVPTGTDLRPELNLSGRVRHVHLQNGSELTDIGHKLIKTAHTDSGDCR